MTDRPDPATSKEPEGQMVVAVAVFCFNQGKYVAQSLESVLSQDPPPDEVFVADDGSADDSLAIARSTVAELANGTNVAFLSDGTNRGLAARMNQVLRATSATHLVWVAADDMLAPKGLALLTTVATAHASADVVFGDLDVMNQFGISRGYRRPGDTWQGGIAKRYLDGGYPYWDLLRYNNFIPGGMSLIRVATLRAAGGYEECVRTEDFNMWLRIGRTSKFCYVGGTVGRYRITPDSESRTEKISVLDHATLLRRRTADNPPARSMVAKLVALRWALSLVRTRGRPAVSLAEVSSASGVPVARIVRKLPAAVLSPLLAAVRSRTSRGRTLRAGIAT